MVHPLDPPLHKVTLQMTEQKRFAKGIMSESRCAIRKFSAQLEGKGGGGWFGIMMTLLQTFHQKQEKEAQPFGVSSHRFSLKLHFSWKI